MLENYIGRVVKDRYRLIRGVSAATDDYLFIGEDLQMGKTVSIRVIPYKFTDADSYRDGDTMFKNQLDVLCRLDHPGLPQVLDGFTEKTEMYIVTEFVEGETLEEKIKNKDTFSEEDIFKWAFDILKILEYLHSRYPPVIFRDLKPANILMKKNRTIQLINFGLARTYKPFKVQDTLIRGSKGYAAPEQYGGKGQTDARADVYSFGITIHQIITFFDPSKNPFQLPPISDFRKDLSEGWQEVISKATELKPELRYKSVKEIMHALEDIKHGKPRKVEAAPEALKESAAESQEEQAEMGQKSSLRTAMEEYERKQAQKKKLLLKVLVPAGILVALILVGVLVFSVFENIAIGIIILGICALFAGAACYFFLFREDSSERRF